MRTARCLVGFILSSVCTDVQAAEAHAAALVAQILESKRAIEHSPACTRGCGFISAWDFEGTILKGDASEGLIENDKVSYPGLLQKSIEAGYCSVYSIHDFQSLLRDYEEKDNKLINKNLTQRK